MDAFLQQRDIVEPAPYSVKQKKTYDFCSFDETIKRRKKTSEGECFLCKFGATDQARETHQNIKRMLEIIRDGILRLPLDMIAKDVSEFYTRHIYNIATNNGQQLPEFTPEDVRRHIEFHITAPSIILAVRMSRTRELIQYVEDHIVKADEDGNVTIDHKAIKSLVDLSKELKSLMDSTPKTSFMNDRFLETM